MTDVKLVWQGQWQMLNWCEKGNDRWKHLKNKGRTANNWCGTNPPCRYHTGKDDAALPNVLAYRIACCCFVVNWINHWPYVSYAPFPVGLALPRGSPRKASCDEVVGLVLPRGSPRKASCDEVVGLVLPRGSPRKASCDEVWPSIEAAAVKRCRSTYLWASMTGTEP